MQNFNSKREPCFSVAVFSFFPFCPADVNQSLYPLFFCFDSKFKIPQPSGLYLRTHPPPCFSWYRCGLFIKVRQQEIPQIFRGPAIRQGNWGQVEKKKARVAKIFLYMGTKTDPENEKWEILKCWEKYSLLHRERQDLESQKRKDKRRNRSTFGLSSHPLFLSGNTSCCWLTAAANMFVAHEREDFGKRPLGSRQKNTQQWRLRGGLLDILSHKHADTHTHTFKVILKEGAVCLKLATVANWCFGLWRTATPPRFNSDLKDLQKNSEQGREREKQKEVG